MAAATSPFNVVLLGTTGNGKSATGNCIVGRNVFKESEGQRACTLSCRSEEVAVRNVKLNVIDTPGFMDTEAKDKDRETAILQCIQMACNGVSAFLYVLKYGSRFTKAEADALRKMADMFGNQSLKMHMIVVFTCKFKLLESQQFPTTESYLEKGLSDETKELLAEVSNRYVFVENKAPPSSNMPQLEQLAILDKIEELMKKNNNVCYSSDKFFKVHKAVYVTALIRIAVFHPKEFQLFVKFSEAERIDNAEVDVAYKVLFDEVVDLRRNGIALTWGFILATSGALVAGAAFAPTIITTYVMPMVNSLKASGSPAISAAALSAALKGLDRTLSSHPK